MLRKSPVAKARGSEDARAKASPKTSGNGWPVHSFMTLMADLSTLILNEVALPGRVLATMPMPEQPTRLQVRAPDLLGVAPEDLHCVYR